MPRFAFSYATIEMEIESFVEIAHSFLRPETTWALENMRHQLTGVRTNTAGTSRWGIALETPLVTKPCAGQYQLGGHGHHDVSASISSIWEIRPVAADPGHQFEIVGNASCLVVLLDVGGAEPIELGRFHIDIGGQGGPGSLFHLQIPEQPNAEVFPGTLDVPRFPMPPFTPIAVVEFVLGELFQDEWRREMSKGRTPHHLWRGIQRNRLTNFLDWQLQIICGRKGDGTASPLLDLKHTPIEPALLLDGFPRVFSGAC